MKVKSESEVAQLRPTPSDPMDCSLPGSSVHRTFQARVLEWVAISFSLYVTVIYYLYQPRQHIKQQIHVDVRQNQYNIVISLHLK